MGWKMILMRDQLLGKINMVYDDYAFNAMYAT